MRTTVLLAACLGCSAWLHAVAPVVSSVQAWQRPGTKLVDITYTLVDPDSPTLDVTLRVSEDAGVTWTVPCPSLVGDGVGPAVTPGASKGIVWDAGADWNGQWSDAMRVEVAANDEFVHTAGGVFTMGNSMDAADGLPHELPAHQVEVTAFCIGRFGVTKDLWDEVGTWAAGNGYDLAGVGAGRAGAHPVQGVYWYDAVK